MANEAELRQRRARGHAAELILNDELVKEAFATIERRIYTAWRNSEPDDDRARHDCYLMHNLFTDFRRFFETVVQRGTQAQKELIRLGKQ